MKLVASLAVSAAGAWLAGTATALVGFSALQSRLPAMMSRTLDARPHVEEALVLLGTGPCAPDSTRAETVRAGLEAEHGRPVVYVDLTVAPGASARRAAQARERALQFNADFALEHSDLDGDRPVPADGAARRPSAGPGL
ncbi:hypothetical protein ACH9EU_05985 [Kocuria sp. M1R5S2]|uniref:hypothetical protein n=1 Tax=Kocuria rhizosphaerae TaxID=3376285 RepID=UPI003798957C